MDEYGKIPSARVFYDYVAMDGPMVRRFATKLSEAMLGYYNSLSGYMQGKWLKKFVRFEKRKLIFWIAILKLFKKF